MKKQPMLKWLIFGLCVLALFLGVRLTQAASVRRTPTPSSAQQIDMDAINSLHYDLTEKPELTETIGLALTKFEGLATIDYLKNIYTYNHQGTPQVNASANMPTFKESMPNVPTGIYTGNVTSLMRLSNNDVKINNWWYGIVLDQYVYIFAGAKGADPSQGVLVIQIVPLSGFNMGWYQFLAPVKSGGLTVTGQNSNRLTLTTSGGDTLYFDIASQSFISSLDAISPVTKTPIPNTTPTYIPTRTPNPDPLPMPTNPYPYP